jgi:hypothetical protein
VSPKTTFFVRQLQDYEGRDGYGAILGPSGGDWRLSGIGALWSGKPYTVGCSVTGARIGYCIGTPTGGLPCRCQMNGNASLPGV